ncbi:hypothetical protein HG826_12380 [Streptomyces sp. GMY01]|uniref:hypothetical protein n=1 Tax=Streptomyces sp. GMY02 TaxID=1333528 RepID=UPI00146C730B|nr:hypothetical protein [Streptomyces sp. GMY02]NMO34377.1 hypothetical protein [Streptomyces sp. GMY02]
MRYWNPLFLAAALALSTAAPATAAQAGPPRPPASAEPATPVSAEPATPDCAWHPLGYRTSNVAYPDTNSQYWLLHYTVQPGLTISLDGRYPDARYASFASYDAANSSFTGPDGAASVLTDHRIDPDRGSRNPYRQPVRPGGKFTVTVTERAAARPNALPLAPAGTAEGAQGTVVYRVYLPHGTIRLPQVTFLRGGHRARVATCADARTTPAPPADAPTTPAPPASADAAPERPAFARQGGAGLYLNPDNAYLVAGFDAPPAGQVLVVRGKAPTATTGDRARPWPDPKAQVRYWSMCDNLWWGPGEVVANPLPDGTVDPGCRADFDTRLDADGTYTYVIGTEQQRAAVESVPGVTFVPLSAATPTARHLLILRDMVADPGFAEAIQNVPTGSDPARTAQVMGAYYPRTAYCALTALTAAGPSACPVS